jgi:hypothetical protein
MVLGLAGPEELADAGSAALDDGLDSPALITLADADRNDARAVFERALTELRVPKPSTREAILRLAHDTATEILDGTIAPYTGARRIWELTLRAPTERIPELDPFIYAASEWEDRPEDRVHFEQGIILEARTLAGR